MTIPEVNRAIKAWGWREKRRNQFAAMSLYRLPTLIGIAILDAKKYPEIFEVFPELFQEDEVKEKQEAMRVMKDVDTFKAWADRFNQKLERNE